MLAIKSIIIVIALSKIAHCKHQVLSIAHKTSVSDTNCVPWTKKVNSHNGHNCNECIKDKNLFDGKLKCDTATRHLSVLDCFCVTYQNDTNDTIVVGACIENCMNLGKHVHDNIYNFDFPPQKENFTSINQQICGKRFKRTGRLCGKCLNGFFPLAYSYNITCVKCPEGNRNLWKYFTIALVPLTCFYFVVLFFKINITSSHMHGYVIFAQALALPEYARLIILTLDAEISLDQPVKFVGSLFSIWNLDFFRLFNWGICLDMSPLAVRALDYAIAVYPFFLTVISYALIELHDRNVRIVVTLWKPFRYIFTLFRRNWDIRTSVIDAYATFFHLSWFKTLCISFDYLIPTYVYTVGKSKNNVQLALYYDGTLDYFGSEHLPYAIIALCFLIFFVILPIIILIVYPCRCFQYILNRININSQFFRIFMDSIYGCYKDGTEPGTRDFRWFAALDLIFRLSMFVVYLLTLGSLFFPFGVILILLIVILLCHLRPHKECLSHYTKIDITFYCLLALYYTSINAGDIASIKARYYTKACFVISVIIAFVPLLYITCLSAYWVFTRARRRFQLSLISRVWAWRRGYNKIEESLPDRITNPEQYNGQRMEDTASITIESDNRSTITY